METQLAENRAFARGWVRFAMAVALLAISDAGILTARAERPPAADLRSRVIRALGQRAFVRDATCRQFSSVILAQNGLPELGKQSPVIGSRGDIDRRGEALEPPIFRDGTQRSKSPLYEIRVAGIREGAGRWRLELRRNAVVTTFSFRVASAANRASCELQTITLAAAWSESGKPRSLHESHDADSCLKLFSAPDPYNPYDAYAELMPEPAPGQAWIEAIRRRDCAVGLRYFESVKAALRRPSR